MGNMSYDEFMEAKKAAYLKMTTNEVEVYDRIAEDMRKKKYPADFFFNTSVQELNKIFGGHGSMVVTPLVKQNLEYFQEFVNAWETILDGYEDLPEDDEEDEE